MLQKELKNFSDFRNSTSRGRVKGDNADKKHNNQIYSQFGYSNLRDLSQKQFYSYNRSYNFHNFNLRCCHYQLCLLQTYIMNLYIAVRLMATFPDFRIAISCKTFLQVNHKFPVLEIFFSVFFRFKAQISVIIRIRV